MQVDLPLKIIGLGRYLPKRIVPSSELEALCGLPCGLGGAAQWRARAQMGDG